jgi:hypothetical protein
MADTLNLLSLKSRHRVMETPACTIAGLGVKPNTPTAFRLINKMHAVARCTFPRDSRDTMRADYASRPPDRLDNIVSSAVWLFYCQHRRLK